MTDFLTLKSVDEVLAMLERFRPLPEETAPLAALPDRILAAPLAAPHDLPGFDRSTMDGFAVRARDVFGASEGLPAILALAGECVMGEVPGFAVEPGQAARIWTGGMLPQGADAVVMLEHSRPAGTGAIELTRPAAPGDNVIARDEDARMEEVLLSGGHKLRPQDIGLLAALGQEHAAVIRKPRVAIISSGDEIVPVDTAPRPGQVRDINAHALAALVGALGGESRFLGISADSVPDLRRRVDEGLDWADAVVLSGGSSAGQRDYTIAVFSAIPGAEILVHGVAISPGKPLILAQKGQQSLWGLPGHAASALVCAEVFLRPLLRRLSGCAAQPVRWRDCVQAVLTRPVASAQGRRDYIRVKLETRDAGGTLYATPVPGKSGLVSTLVLADGLAVCPEDLEGLYEGQTVEVQIMR